MVRSSQCMVLAQRDQCQTRSFLNRLSSEGGRSKFIPERAIFASADQGLPVPDPCHSTWWGKPRFEPSSGAPRLTPTTTPTTIRQTLASLTKNIFIPDIGRVKTVTQSQVFELLHNPLSVAEATEPSYPSASVARMCGIFTCHR